MTIPKYAFQVVVDTRVNGNQTRRAKAFETLGAAWEYVAKVRNNPLTRHISLLAIVHDEACCGNGQDKTERDQWRQWERP